MEDVKGQPEVRAQRQRAQRLPAAERRAVILSEASIFFAKEGFSASTRDLADRLGVRQALLYKYYPSKEALLEAIFEQVFASHWAMEWAKVLDDQSKSLEDRLTLFYCMHLENEEGIGLRLFLRAALDGWSLPARKMELLKVKLVLPLIAEMRRAAKLPGLEALPLLAGELELVMALHSSVIFYSIRSNIYNIDVASDVSAVMRLYVSTFLIGASVSLGGLHGPDAHPSLTLPAGQGKSSA
jgi:AcrR family transcriptional regulator